MEHAANTTHLPVLGGLSPPPGITPNFVDPYNISGNIIAVLTVCLTSSTLLVWTRMYTRFYITKSHGWDDYTSFAAWLGLVAAFGLFFVNLKYGAGTHQWDVPLEHVIIFLKILYAQSILYAPLLFTVKLSILLTYRRIFVSTRRDKTYFATYLLIWINFLYYAADFFFETFECIPPRKIWEPFIPGHCFNHLERAIVTCTINFASDFSILLLPIGKIWHLQIPAKRKISISAAFAIGLLACVSSMMSLIETIKNLTNEDVTYHVVGRALWATAEITFGILSGCLPVLPRFFRHFNFRLPSKPSSITLILKRVSPSNSPPITSTAAKRSGPKDVSWGSHKIKSTCFELDKRTDDDLLSTNTTGGEGCSYSAEVSAAGRDPDTENHEDLERGIPESCILKMVRIETSNFQ